MPKVPRELNELIEGGLVDQALTNPKHHKAVAAVLRAALAWGFWCMDAKTKDEASEEEVELIDQLADFGDSLLEDPNCQIPLISAKGPRTNEKAS